MTHFDEKEKVVTEWVLSHINKEQGRVRRLRIDIDTLKDLFAEGHKLAASEDHEITLNRMPVSVDPALKYREVVVEYATIDPISDQMRKWIEENES